MKTENFASCEQWNVEKSSEGGIECLEVTRKFNIISSSGRRDSNSRRGWDIWKSTWYFSSQHLFFFIIKIKSQKKIVERKSKKNEQTNDKRLWEKYLVVSTSAQLRVFEDKIDQSAYEF